jgi:hypothetical protein
MKTKLMDGEIERCRREVAAIEAELRAGNLDVEGLCLALTDWSEELRILQLGSGARGDDDSLR